MPFELPRKAFIAVLLVLVCGLMLSSWTTITLRSSNINAEFALNLARLIFVPLTGIACWLVVRKHRQHLGTLYPRRLLTTRIVLTGIAVGILARILWWNYATFRGAIGWFAIKPGAVPVEYFHYACPPLVELLVAIAVFMLLVPIVEEFVHRGLIFSALQKHGIAIAVIGSSLLFALMHKPSSYVLAFCFGVLFALQHKRSTALWLPTITHATYDLMTVFDWSCTQIHWQYSSNDSPMIGLAISLAVAAIGLVAAIAMLTRQKWIGPHVAARPISNVG